MVKEVKAVDDNTVQFILSYPYAPLLSILASTEGSILSPKAIAEQADKLSKTQLEQGHSNSSPGRQGKRWFLSKMIATGEKFRR